MCRCFVRVLAVVLIGVGVALMTWGIVAAALGEPLEKQHPLTELIGTASFAIGCGAGLLAAGVTTLVLSLVGPGSPCGPKE